MVYVFGAPRALFSLFYFLVTRQHSGDSQPYWPCFMLCLNLLDLLASLMFSCNWAGVITIRLHVDREVTWKIAPSEATISSVIQGNVILLIDYTLNLMQQRAKSCDTFIHKQGNFSKSGLEQASIRTDGLFLLVVHCTDSPYRISSSSSKDLNAEL